MEITALQPHRSAADIAPEQLAGNKLLTEDQKIAEGARQFEALLLRQILQESQKTVIPSKFSDNSTTAGIYRDMITQQLADSISKSGSLGLARSLERQLTRQLHPASPAGQDASTTTLPTSLVGSAPARPLLPDGPLARVAASEKCAPPARAVPVADACHP